MMSVLVIEQDFQLLMMVVAKGGEASAPGMCGSVLGEGVPLLPRCCCTCVAVCCWQRACSSSCCCCVTYCQAAIECNGVIRQTAPCLCRSWSCWFCCYCRCLLSLLTPLLLLLPLLLLQVHLWRVAESVVRLTRPLMRDHVRILNCISKDMPPIKGDSARLMQVILRLIGGWLVGGENGG